MALGEVEARRGLGEGLHSFTTRERASEPLPSFELGIGRDDEVGDREVDDGVAEELQSFVRLALVFGGVARVRQGDGAGSHSSRDSPTRSANASSGDSNRLTCLVRSPAACRRRS